MGQFDGYDYDKAAEAQVRANKAAGMGTGGGGNTGMTGTLGEGLASVTKNFNPFNSALTVGGKVIQGFESTYNSLHGVIAPSLKTWRELSTTGQAFGGDVVAMGTAAYSARLDLDDFASIVAKNSQTMGAFGGFIGRGSEAFAQVSKEWFDSGMTDSMRALGYTNKELNEVLALTISNQRTIDMTDPRQRREAYESAQKLAKEMDEMAKLTGKSRKEQEEIMEKSRRDMQLNARIDLETRNMTEEQAREYRKKVMDQVLQAETQGLGDVFKETYATGAVYSAEAANKVGLLGDEASSMMAAANASRQGQFDRAQEAQERSHIANMENSKNVGLLTIRTMGPLSSASDSLNKHAQDRLAETTNMENVRARLEKDASFQRLSDVEKEKAVRAEALRLAKEPPATKGDGQKSTQALIALESTSKTVASSFMNDLVTPLNRKVSPAMDAFANKLNGTVIKPDGSRATLASELKAGADAGREKKTETGTRQERIDAASGGGKNSMPFTVMEGASTITNGLGDIINKATDKVIPKQASGSKDTFGSWFGKDFGAGGLSMLHGKEAVVPEAKLGEFMSDMQKQMGGGLGGLTNIAKGFDPSQMQRMVVDQLRNIPKPEMPQPQQQQAQPVAQNTNTFGGNDVNLNDAVSLLEQLNKQMGELISHTENIADNSSKQVRVTKGLSNNKFA